MSDNPQNERPGLASRQVAARLLASVVDKKVSLDGLTNADNGNATYLALSERDRSLTRAIVNSALRHRRAIEAGISARLQRPLPQGAKSLGHILHVAAAQILYLDVPDSAAVDLAVSQAQQDPRSKRFASLVNAILRRLSREKAAALTETEGLAEGPNWLVERLEAFYGPVRTGAILKANLANPAVDLTVKSDPDHWARELNGLVMPGGSVRLKSPDTSIRDSPGYEDGEWWVQDMAASLPVRLFDKLDGLKVADFCAAPGGKTAQLALAGAHVTAFDISANRMRRVDQNLRRLKLVAKLVVTDVLNHPHGDLFDAILVDVPCSSTGTMRRHPDVAWTKTPQDIDKLIKVQARLLHHAVSRLRPGGTVVYSNCSLLPEEGEEIVASVMHEAPALGRVKVDATALGMPEEVLTPDGDMRTTPDMFAHDEARLAGTDGFFASKMRVDA